HRAGCVFEPGGSSADTYTYTVTGERDAVGSSDWDAISSGDGFDSWVWIDIGCNGWHSELARRGRRTQQPHLVAICCRPPAAGGRFSLQRSIARRAAGKSRQQDSLGRSNAQRWISADHRWTPPGGGAAESPRSTTGRLEPRRDLSNRHRRPNRGLLAVRPVMGNKSRTDRAELRRFLARLVEKAEGLQRMGVCMSGPSLRTASP